MQLRGRIRSSITRWMTAAALMMLLFVSCQRRPLEIYYRPTCRVTLDVDWSDFPEVPTGMSAYFYRDGNPVPIIIPTADIYSTEVNLPEGHYNCFVINQTEEEFYSFDFMDMNEFGEAKAVLASTKSRWFKASSTRADIDPSAVAIAPENLGIGLVGEFEITQEMIEIYQADYADWVTKTKSKTTKAEISKRALDATSVHLHATMHNVVCELNVRVHIKNIQYLYSARASMDGLATGVFLHNGVTTEDQTVQLLESDIWTMHVNENDPTSGYIEAKIRTLGLPGQVNTDLTLRDPSANLFTLNCLLVDHTTARSFDFEVGNKFDLEVGVHGLNLALNLSVGTEMEPEITLPEVEPVEGGSTGGFDVNVDEWGQGETVDIPM